jgi:hypothetical protein
LAAVTARALVGITVFREAERDVPAGQPPLRSVEDVGMTAVREAFNAHDDRTRILALLSPT